MNELTINPVQDTASVYVPGVNTLQVYLEQFLNSQDVRPESRETYRRCLNQFEGWINLNNILSPTRDTVIAFKADLEVQGLSPFTISLYVCAVRKFFEWLEGMKYYPNVAKGIKGPRKSKDFQKDPFTIKQIKDLLESIDRSSLQGLRDYAILNLMIHSGLRTIEIIRANVGDIRIEGEEITLWVQGKGKGSKDDFVLLTPKTLKPIQDYLSCRQDNDKNSPLFASLSNRNQNQRLTTRSIRGLVKTHLRDIGIDNDRLSAHSTRHFFGVMSIKAGVSLYDTQLAMRHTNPATTQLYLKSIEREERLKNSAEKRVDEYLGF